MTVSIGATIPDLELAATGERSVKLSEYRGKHLVLYFYPKAGTSGCTQEGQDFRDAVASFAAANTIILGASRDSLKAQETFKAKQGFNFDLLSDPDEALCRAFDVIQPKKMFGKDTVGLERSTFLIDAAGVLRQEWRGVKVKGHVEEVLNAARKLAASPPA